MNLKDKISAIKSALPYSKSARILNRQLGLDQNGVPYYLHFLNLYFGENDSERENAIAKLKDLANDLKEKPKTIKGLITSVNWRPTLVGNAIAILLRDSQFQKDLIWRLENGNWVSPQIAVGIALIANSLAEKELRRIIENASEESNAKTIMSAYSSLKCLGSEFAKEFEQTDLFGFLKEKDSWDNSVSIAERHWEFWRNIEPLN